MSILLSVQEAMNAITKMCFGGVIATLENYGFIDRCVRAWPRYGGRFKLTPPVQPAINYLDTCSFAAVMLASGEAFPCGRGTKWWYCL